MTNIKEKVYLEMSNGIYEHVLDSISHELRTDTLLNNVYRPVRFGTSNEAFFNILFNLDRALDNFTSSGILFHV